MAFYSSSKLSFYYRNKFDEERRITLHHHVSKVVIFYIDYKTKLTGGITMIIDLTYSCKMGCSHCMSDCKPEGKNMSIQVLKDSLDFLKKYQIPTWYFSGGEIFEHPDILKILEIIETEWMKESFRFPLALITNGRELVRNKKIYDYIYNLIKRHGKKYIYIQVTDDSRFYPDKLTEKERYWLSKIASVIEGVPGDPKDKNKCLYPQGRALHNYSEKNWYTVGPKCINPILMIKQDMGISKMVMTMLMKGKMCVPVIAPDGSIKLGESALCPAVASIYDTEDEIIDKIKNFHCRQCKIAWEKLKENSPETYFILNCF